MNTLFLKEWSSSSGEQSMFSASSDTLTISASILSVLSVLTKTGIPLVPTGCWLYSKINIYFINSFLAKIKIAQVSSRGQGLGVPEQPPAGLRAACMCSLGPPTYRWSLLHSGLWTPCCHPRGHCTRKRTWRLTCSLFCFLLNELDTETNKCVNIF